MKYPIIIISVIIVVLVGAIFFTKNKSSKSKNMQDVNDAVVNNECVSRKLAEVDDTKTKLTIKIDALPPEIINKNTKMVEVTDKKVLSRINQVIPVLLQTGNAANNAIQAANANGKVLYRAIIPAGAKLVDSKGMKDAVRGFYRGAKDIQGHANFVAVEAQKGTEIVANAASATMGIASMIVGQYYMKQLNEEIAEINDGLTKIADFQNNEYRSRVLSLASHIKSISGFEVEIIENDELRQLKLKQLDSLEEECTQLLGQANITLTEFTKKTDIKYNEYEKEVTDAQQWYIFQKTLLELHAKIAELKYTLHLGNVTREQCSANLIQYAKNVEDTQILIVQWHKNTVERLNIDIESLRRKRDGFDSFVHLIPGLFKADYKYRKMHENTATMIYDQALGESSKVQQDTSDLYSEDVQILLKDGKIYYLPEGAK